jgi:S1-C subfamily serine protease
MPDRRSIAPLALLALVVAACGSAPKSNEPSSPSRTATTPQQRADPSKSVVAVEGIYPDKQTKVTGVVWDAGRGLVLTANHGMEAAPSIDVHLADGTLTHARPVARAQCHDMAVIKLFPRPSGLESIALGDSDKVQIGDPVSTMTFLFPSGKGNPALTKVNGSISSLNVDVTWAPLPEVGPLLAHQTSLSAPASGSALLDERGRLIGLNTLVDHPSEPDTEGIEYALPSNYVKQRMSELRPGKGGALGGWEAEHNRCHHALRALIGKGHEHDPNAPAGHEDEGH